MNKEEIQKRYLGLQDFSLQLKQLQEQLANLEAQIFEMQRTKESIEDLEKMKNKKEILIPISNGIYTKAELNSSDKLLVNIGADLMVNKSFEETKKLIDEQIQELGRIINELNLELRNGSLNFQYMQREFQELASKT